MVRSKQRPKRVVGIDSGAAWTEIARYATREDRHFCAGNSITFAGNANHILASSSCKDDEALIAGVLDGHRGAGAAECAAQALYPAILRQLEETGPGSDAATALARAFADCDRRVLSGGRYGPGLGDDDVSGACCCVALVVGATLNVAWLGDCRALIASRSGPIRRLTVDHTPTADRARVEFHGGVLLDDDGLARVALRPDEGCRDPDSDSDLPEPSAKRKREVAALACSRAFGDRDFKAPRRVLTAVPGIAASIDLTADDDFVLIATDGVHESLDDAAAVGAARAALADAEARAVPSHPPEGTETTEERNCRLCELAARAAVDAAVAAGATDDVTAVVLRTRVG